jgi:uncharacterized membrane protein
MRRRATYVLRLWTEDPPSTTAQAHADQAELRGSLQAVDVDELRHFASQEQLIALVQRIINDLTRGDEMSD